MGNLGKLKTICIVVSRPDIVSNPIKPNETIEISNIISENNCGGFLGCAKVDEAAIGVFFDRSVINYDTIVEAEKIIKKLGYDVLGKLKPELDIPKENNLEENNSTKNIIEVNPDYYDQVKNDLGIRNPIYIITEVKYNTDTKEVVIKLKQSNGTVKEVKRTVPPEIVGNWGI